jgi:phosphopantothenoylcysteine decarboxylase/phosphopantothenate--cysteine ligase
LAKPLQNKKVLITAGPTREYWDPVRYLTNGSTGRMGIALADAAMRLGAKVTLILGPIGHPPENSAKLRVVPVVSAWDMYEAVKKQLSGTDIFIGSAAVVDYRPAEQIKLKIKRHTPSLTLKLYGNPDIIAMVGHLKKNRPSCVLGFALETDHMVENAVQKMARKHMDWIVANRETNMGQAIGEGTLLSKWGHRVAFQKMTKEKLAQKIWQTILAKN